MQTTQTEVKKMLKPNKTMIEVTQQINNVTRMNTHGQHNERLAKLLEEKKAIELWIRENTKPLVMQNYAYSEAEIRYIELSRKETQYTITE